MEKRDQVVRFMPRWTKGPIPDAILARFDAAAHRRCCWVQLFKNPLEKEQGVLFWVETYADGCQDKRMELFCNDVLRTTELSDLRDWFLLTSRGTQP